jgi:hypothetical protein
MQRIGATGSRVAYDIRSFLLTSFTPLGAERKKDGNRRIGAVKVCMDGGFHITLLLKSGSLDHPPAASFILPASSSALPTVSLSSSTSPCVPSPSPPAERSTNSLPNSSRNLGNNAFDVPSTEGKLPGMTPDFGASRSIRSCRQAALTSASPHARTRSNHFRGSRVTLSENPWEVMRWRRWMPIDAIYASPASALSHVDGEKATFSVDEAKTPTCPSG